jgi:hypothetical protein
LHGLHGGARNVRLGSLWPFGMPGWNSGRGWLSRGTRSCTDYTEGHGTYVWVRSGHSGCPGGIRAADGCHGGHGVARITRRDTERTSGFALAIRDARVEFGPRMAVTGDTELHGLHGRTRNVRLGSLWPFGMPGWNSGRGWLSRGSRSWHGLHGGTRNVRLGSLWPFGMPGWSSGRGWLSRGSRIFTDGTELHGTKSWVCFVSRFTPCNRGRTASPVRLEPRLASSRLGRSSRRGSGGRAGRACWRGPGGR